MSKPLSAEPPHDILAAEEFAMPAPDPDLRGPLRLPEDPTGIAAPHDVLAAEEFAIPAAHVRARTAGTPAGRRGAALAAGAVALLVIGALLQGRGWLLRGRWRSPSARPLRRR